MGLFEGKKGLICGVFNSDSIAWSISHRLLEEGATAGFTHLPDKDRPKNHGRVEQLISPYGDQAAFLMPLDVTIDDHIAAVAKKTADTFGKIDFLIHAIAFAPPEDLKKETILTSREGFLTAMNISVYSLISLSAAVRDLLNPGASVLTLTYFGGEKCVPGYNVMGICKAALDSTVQYLAYDLGLQQARCNAISAGPVRTISGRGAGVDKMLQLYEAVAPLQRNITADEIGHTGAFLLSDRSSGITGEILHLDCGYNIMGSPGRAADKMSS